jgi:putative DNA primase/helicase
MMNFIDFARAHGVEIGKLHQGDRIYRCPTTAHPKSTNGAYYFDGRRGWVQSWESGEPVAWWNDETAEPWTAEQKREWAQRKRDAEAAKERGYAEAAKRAAMLITKAARTPHPYLKEKGFPEALCLTLDDAILVPMRDCTSDALRGLQSIRLVDNEWQKKMLPGMRAKGAVLRIGPPRLPESILVEGFATALSVDAAARFLKLRAATVVCFSAGNMVHVAPKLQGRKFIFADNDASETGEKAAKETGLPYCMADEVGMDANDLMVREGVMAVAAKLMAVRRA